MFISNECILKILQYNSTQDLQKWYNVSSNFSSLCLYLLKKRHQKLTQQMINEYHRLFKYDYCEYYKRDILQAYFEPHGVEINYREFPDEYGGLIHDPEHKEFCHDKLCEHFVESFMVDPCEMQYIIPECRLFKKSRSTGDTSADA